MKKIITFLAVVSLPTSMAPPVAHTAYRVTPLACKVTIVGTIFSKKTKGTFWKKKPTHTPTLCFIWKIFFVKKRKHLKYQHQINLTLLTFINHFLLTQQWWLYTAWSYLSYIYVHNNQMCIQFDKSHQHWNNQKGLNNDHTIQYNLVRSVQESKLEKN